jgi:hypothetical protein
VNVNLGLALGEEQPENRVLRKIFGCKRELVTGEWRYCRGTT